ncbi:MAG TPA: DUF1284 domain-containing protein [Nitrospirales bacterium]|nr:DUF1284 domain-containing protein [Nitrospirales bacterium]
MNNREQSLEDRGAFRIRGHTLLCLQGFRGEGYNAGFIENMAALHRDLNENPDRWVEVVEAPDTFCAACPHLVPAGCSLNGAHSEEGMQAQDRHVLELLGLQSGTRVRWREVLDRVRTSVKGSDLPVICGSCRWLPLGYCRDGIDQLRRGQIIGVDTLRRDERS